LKKIFLILPILAILAILAIFLLIYLQQKPIQKIKTLTYYPNKTSIQSTKVKKPNIQKNLNPSCDNKKICSQMRSCEEAKFYLHNCGLKKLDRDKDGIPCEGRWCFKNGKPS